MNEKENILLAIVEAVVESCRSTTFENFVTKENVLGKSRDQNVVMTRAILTKHLIHAGYSHSTVASILGKTVQAIRHLLLIHDSYIETSKAYQFAYYES